MVRKLKPVDLKKKTKKLKIPFFSQILAPGHDFPLH